MQTRKYKLSYIYALLFCTIYNGYTKHAVYKVSVYSKLFFFKKWKTGIWYDSYYNALT